VQHHDRLKLSAMRISSISDRPIQHLEINKCKMYTCLWQHVASNNVYCCSSVGLGLTLERSSLESKPAKRGRQIHHQNAIDMKNAPPNLSRQPIIAVRCITKPRSLRPIVMSSMRATSHCIFHNTAVFVNKVPFRVRWLT